MTLLNRIQHLAWSWCTVGFIYGTTRFAPGNQWIIPETTLDKLIPFNPQGIWFYLAFFLYVPLAFLVAPAERVLTLRYAVQISAAISGLVFIFFPTSISYPQTTGDDIHSTALGLLTFIDTRQNCLPSLHAALTFLCLLSLWDWKAKLRTFFFTGIACMIGFSIIQLRRHLSIDVAAGLLVGIFSHKLVTIYKTRFNAMERTYE